MGADCCIVAVTWNYGMEYSRQLKDRLLSCGEMVNYSANLPNFLYAN